MQTSHAVFVLLLCIVYIICTAYLRRFLWLSFCMVFNGNIFRHSSFIDLFYGRNFINAIGLRPNISMFYVEE